MSDLPGNVWSFYITALDYTIQRNGGAPNPVVNLPGACDPSTGLPSGTYTLPSGVSVTAGTGLVRFNFRGQPIAANGSLVAPLSITVCGALPITVTQDTGFIP